MEVKREFTNSCFYRLLFDIEEQKLIISNKKTRETNRAINLGSLEYVRYYKYNSREHPISSNHIRESKNDRLDSID